MNDLHVWVLRWLSAAVILLAALPATAEQGSNAETARRGTIRVTIVGFDHDQGDALVGLYRSEDGFPSEGRKAAQRKKSDIRRGRAEVRFTSVRPGPFAVSVLHDEDGDQKMKTGLFGIPKEGYGVSRDAVRRFGPPRFEDAALSLRPGENKHIRIRMHY